MAGNSATIPKQRNAAAAAEEQPNVSTKKKSFVESEHGRAMIDKAGQVDSSEAQDLENAEQDGLSRTTGDDPAVTRKK